MNETIGALTLVAYRNKGTHGNVSLLFYAQNLEAQQGLDYVINNTVRPNITPKDFTQKSKIWTWDCS